MKVYSEVRPNVFNVSYSQEMEARIFVRDAFTQTREVQFLLNKLSCDIGFF